MRANAQPSRGPSPGRGAAAGGGEREKKRTGAVEELPATARHDAVEMVAEFAALYKGGLKPAASLARS